jgi:hypothetical protein
MSHVLAHLWNLELKWWWWWCMVLPQWTPRVLLMHTNPKYNKTIWKTTIKTETKKPYTEFPYPFSHKSYGKFIYRKYKNSQNMNKR